MERAAISPRKLEFADADCGSPRRISLARERFSDDEQEQSKTQATKPAEVHGFVGAVSSIAAFLIFLIWAYVPEPWLHAAGITYYPDKYWAIAIPSFVMVTIAFVLAGYVSLNYMATPSPDSHHTVYDVHTRRPEVLPVSSISGERPIDPIADIPLTEVNQIMFG